MKVKERTSSSAEITLENGEVFDLVERNGKLDISASQVSDADGGHHCPILLIMPIATNSARLSCADAGTMYHP